MFLNTTLNEALQKIGPYSLMVEDALVPKDCPFQPNSSYRREYDWLYHYERILAAKLQFILKDFRYELIGEKGILCEALSNAYLHGHNRNPELPIHVRVYFGSVGVLVRILDSGKGFDIDKVIDWLQRGKRYYNSAGNGMMLMLTSSRFGIFYEAEGRAFHLIYLTSARLADTFVLKSGKIDPEGGDPDDRAPRVNGSKTPDIPRNGDVGTAIKASVIVAHGKGTALVSSFGIDKGKAQDLSRISGGMMRDITRMTDLLGIGEPEQVVVQSPDSTIYIRTADHQRKMSISVFNATVNSTVARIRQATLHKTTIR